MAETPTAPDRLAAIRNVAQLLRSQSRTGPGPINWTPTADEWTHFEAADALTYLLERVERLEAALIAAYHLEQPRSNHHREDCDGFYGDKPCNCGLVQARAALAPDAPHREPHAQETA